jgi:hypothetical protein
VPTIGAKEERQFDITYTLLADKPSVDKALQQVQSIQHDRPTEVRKTLWSTYRKINQRQAPEIHSLAPKTSGH